ncbi:periplasmic binding protein [Pseudodesulfovibrio mercurii]|uniref:Periplasmic binding protein n=1 Tax=Pseudodesulfovibrio mercurii TaxID=641491 RepID=F0JG13_9BACT|nr:ABC transporter substrate-binding protein [Pseudodesulfovibrio mercurii]EGB15009.1 periplasmic binding protein [Pseudodesulfovibrio mercurii]
MKKILQAPLLACLFVLLLFSSALAERTVTDQLGRTVTIPDEVSRVVVLQHQSLDVMIQLGAQDKVVGVLEKWDKYLPGAAKTMPNIGSMPTPGGLDTVNMEALLALNPDLVIVTHYAPKEMIQQISDAKIPVVAVSLFDAASEEAAKLNPELADAQAAYNKGLRDAVLLLGEVCNKQARAERLMQVVDANQAVLKSHLGTIPEDQRIKCYMARNNLHTYGAGKYTSVIMERAGGVNVVAKEVTGFKEVTMEDVLRWNPEVVFIQWRHRSAADELRNDPSWQQVSAIKNGRLYITPEYVKPWGHALPESMALGELWMAKALYPDKFKDVDLDAMVQSYYKEFYGIPFAE